MNRRAQARLTGAADKFFPSTGPPGDPAPGSVGAVTTGPIEELRQSEARVRASVADLTDRQAREPSRLPGWSRGHVLSHLARNADGLARLARWAETGVHTPMYASAESRVAEIEAGSGRPATGLRADLESTAAGLDAALALLSPRGEQAMVELGAARTPLPGSDVFLMRIRELEIHHVDLDVGYEVGHWLPTFTQRSLDQLAPRSRSKALMPVGRLCDPAAGLRWQVGEADGEITGPSGVLLAWLTGRMSAYDAAAAGLQLTGGGDVPDAPPWG